MIIARGGAWALVFLKSHPGNSNMVKIERHWSTLLSKKQPRDSPGPSHSLSLGTNIEVQFPEQISRVLAI